MNRGDKSELEVAFRSFKINAKGADAIRAVRWPVRIMIVAIAICLMVAAFSIHPISWGQSLVAWLASL